MWGKKLIVIDPKGGSRLGVIDVMGGGGFVPDRPEPPIETLADARKRLDELARQITDQKVDLLRSARQRMVDRFVASAPGGITMNTYTSLRGREQAMVDFFERPDFVAAVMDLQAEAVIQRADKILQTGVDCLYIGDPSASASLISPQHFERFCLPAYQKFCSHLKSRGALIYIHICGNSKPILEMMAATGADAVEPLDPLGGVSVADAKRRIGGRVALMGGVNTVTLSSGTAEAVRAEAIQKCREGGPHGYVLAAGDMVPPDTPMENLRAMVDVANAKPLETGLNARLVLAAWDRRRSRSRAAEESHAEAQRPQRKREPSESRGMSRRNEPRKRTSRISNIEHRISNIQGKKEREPSLGRSHSEPS